MKLRITRELKNRLNSTNKNVFSKAIEELFEKHIILSLYDGDEPIQIIPLGSKELNVFTGDLLVYYPNVPKLSFAVEVKTSHTYYVDGKGIPKQVLEMEHYEDYHLSKPYKQNKSNESYKGWFFENKASCLCSYNRDFQVAFMILDWNKVKKKLINENTLDKNHCKKFDNGYLEQIVIKDGYKDKYTKEEVVIKYDLVWSLDLTQLDKVSNEFVIEPIEFIIGDDN